MRLAWVDLAHRSLDEAVLDGYGWARAVGGNQPGAKSMPTTVSRAAGQAFTKVLSRDMAEFNILVNTVCISLIGDHSKSRASCSVA